MDQVFTVDEQLAVKLLRRALSELPTALSPAELKCSSDGRVKLLRLQSLTVDLTYEEEPGTSPGELVLHSITVSQGLSSGGLFMGLEPHSHPQIQEE